MQVYRVKCDNNMSKFLSIVIKFLKKVYKKYLSIREITNIFSFQKMGYQILLSFHKKILSLWLESLYFTLIYQI